MSEATEDIFNRQIARILGQQLLELLRARAATGRPWIGTAWLAAAADMRMDIALERLGELERRGVVTSRLGEDGEEMFWTLGPEGPE
ncbi:MAG: hypothetical protein OXI03_01765 [Chloroflexota bacterium]|nr:hypothetical protein [Chloroflexota bacterium]